jgi:hypothetical protein
LMAPLTILVNQYTLRMARTIGTTITAMHKEACQRKPVSRCICKRRQGVLKASKQLSLSATYSGTVKGAECT